MIWMALLSVFVMIYLGYTLRSFRRRGFLISGFTAIVAALGTGYLYWNLGAYEMSLSTEALQALPENERSYVIAQAAQDEFLARDRQADQDVIKLFQLALELNPYQVTALGSLGIIAFENEDFGNAEIYWSRMLAQLPQESEQARAISAGVARAREQTNLLKQAKLKRGASEIFVTLKLAEAVPFSMETATVFVFARDLEGSPQPLVAKRLPVSQLPTTITLSNADAVMGGGLFNEQQVEIRARLTLGEATGTQGDWMSESSVKTLKPINSIQLILAPPTG